MVVQKTEHGFDLLDNKAKKYLRSNGVTPDTWILPEGTATFLQTVRPENRDYYLAGPGGPDGYKSALNAAPASGIRQIAANSCQVFESKSFEVPGAPMPVDPLVREVSVGEYTTMVDTVSDVVACSDYKSHMRDIYVYDERRDDFSRVSMKTALKACCRFDDSGELWFPPGFSNKYEQDPFIQDSKRPVNVFGDMSERYMPDDLLFKVADSLVCKFLETQPTAGRPDYEAWAAASAFPSAAEPFFKFIQDRLGSSRVFSDAYTPTWRAAGARSGWFYNTVAFRGLAAGRAGAGAYAAAAALRAASVAAFPGGAGPANAMAAISDPPSAGGPGTPGFDGTHINWEVVRKVFGELLNTSSAPLSPSELALTDSTLDKFITKMTLLGDRTAPSEQALVYTTAYLASSIKTFKAAATTGNWLKHYQFVVHKGLLAIAAAATNAATDATIEAFATAILDVRRHPQFQLGVAAVNAALGLGAVGAGAAAAPPPAHHAALPAAIGAFDIAAQNLEYGADEGPAKRAFGTARFGAVLSRRDGTQRGTDGDGGFDTEEPPSGAPPTSVPGFSHSMAARYASVQAADHKVLIKSTMLTLLHTPVTHESLSKLIEHDLYFPFEFLLFRPRITHNMATGVLLKAGTETAETLVGHADFQLTDDVVRKMHYGHFTLYSKTVVWKSDNVYLAENIVATGYVRGNDVSFNTLDSLYTPSGESDVKSIYAALVPVSARHSEDTITSGQGYFNPMDVSGRFAENVPHLRNLDLEVGNPGRLHYPGAEFYASVWRMNNSSQKLETEFVPSQMGSHNTLVFQGHQMTYNPSNGKYDLTTLNTGHFGDRVYPGCGKVRRMANQKWLQPVTYTSAFGASSHITSLGS
jgi:hypothetical protein